jgi:signal transduction histidine kinase/PAS domain-containing protein
MSIKAKQVAGVTTLVVLIVASLSAYHLVMLARLSLDNAYAQATMLAEAIRHRAHQVAQDAPDDPYAALRADGGVRAILESSIGYSRSVTYAALVDPAGVVVAHGFPTEQGGTMVAQADLVDIIEAGALDKVYAVFDDRTFEVRHSVLRGDDVFGEIRIGVSMALVRQDFQESLWGIVLAIVGTIIVSSIIAMLLSQWMLRPIHVIQSGLTRLGRGELDVRLDLPGQEFKDLGSSFAAVSAQISALGRAGASGSAERPGTASDLESVMDNLEDAVALFSPAGEVIFHNAAMEGLLGDLGVSPVGGATLAGLPETHPLKSLVERTLVGRKSAGPIAVDSLALTSSSEPAAAESERLLMSHAIVDTGGRFLGAMLVSRNIGYLNRVHSTLQYSSKLAALGRLMAGVAHEVKNPLNAMTIHLELLKQKLTKQAAMGEADGARRPARPGTATSSAAVVSMPDVTKHVNVIADEIRRLDEVVAGFLKFARPDELKLQPVSMPALISDVGTTVGPQAAERGIIVKTECPADLPEINADLGMLQQALLNLALNACDAMPDGGTLRVACRAASRHRVEIQVEDTGVGIPPENLGRIFDLYFTTKPKGSGIGLSMVFRIVQLHGGEVEVESTPGAGTTFKLSFPQV